MPFWKRLERKDSQRQLLLKLEQRLAELEKCLADDGPRGLKGCTIVVIEHADRVNVDKIDYSNHFGTLEVDRLEGQLNIGRNHLAGDGIGIDDHSEDKSGADGDTIVQGEGKGPKCNIQPRKS